MDALWQWYENVTLLSSTTSPRSYLMLGLQICRWAMKIVSVSAQPRALK